METMGQEKPGVLFVDDEENVLKALSRLFADEPYDIYAATSGAQGLDVLKRNRIAVVVSDQGMPQMKGAEFLEHVKEASPDTVRIMLTGYADLNAAIDAINKGGAYQYITKPWDDGNLLLSVHAAAEKYRLVKENVYLTELTRRQKEELENWNAELETAVQQQTIDLTYKNKEMMEAHDRMKRSFRDFTITISNLIELRNREVGSHSNTVAKISREMAKELGLSEEETESLALAAQLHDIGKVGIVDAILMKNIDQLTGSELTEYRKHPVRGQAVIDSNDALRGAGSLIRGHHEWFNGEGFPDGLKGEAIPLGARIISIADKYDRLTKDISMEMAFEEIWSLRSLQFDPSLYYPLEKIAKERRIAAVPPDRSVETEMESRDLVSGTMLSRDVRSGTGILLLSKGVVLDVHRIDSVLRYFRLDPPESTKVCVWAEKE